MKTLAEKLRVQVEGLEPGEEDTSLHEKMDRGLRTLEDFMYLLHHVHPKVDGGEELHHCMVCDHKGNMFELTHLLIKDGKVYLNGKTIKEGQFHIISGLEPTQEVAWSDTDAEAMKVKPKKMVAGMTLKQKAGEW